MTETSPPYTSAEQAIIAQIEALDGEVSEIIDVEDAVIVRVADKTVNDTVAAMDPVREQALQAALDALNQRREAQAREQPPDEVE